jgi:hypothetical protein
MNINVGTLLFGVIAIVVAVVLIGTLKLLGLSIYGLLFGFVLLLDGIFEWGLAVTVRESSRTELKVSKIVIGGLLMVAGIAGVATSQ